jgi:hypothetical protein
MSKPLKTIVIGTSLTDESDGVVRTAAALARATGASPWLGWRCSSFAATQLDDEAERRERAGADWSWVADEMPRAASRA